ncbi:hypothetical protein J1N35_009462 [Gossypium stocksii]|uniref:Uncharacterized protein n=1 Tax=Gossypium stocksii TaxID=47602 RepID=A0A9D3VYF9_9ROSI|nr:hypothetical protein J1N35_009462 [Gossypium stocksii]
MSQHSRSYVATSREVCFIFRGLCSDIKGSLEISILLPMLRHTTLRVATQRSVLRSLDKQSNASL